VHILHPHAACTSYTHNYERCRPRACIQKTLPAASWHMSNGSRDHGRCNGQMRWQMRCISTWDALAHEMRCQTTGVCLQDASWRHVLLTTSSWPHLSYVLVCKTCITTHSHFNSTVQHIHTHAHTHAHAHTHIHTHTADHSACEFIQKKCTSKTGPDD